MFKPELKDTGWKEVEETVFSISGESYIESDFNCELSTLINDSLMDKLWDSITISELEKYLTDAVSNSNKEVVLLRLELNDDFIYGWVHYKDIKKINTLRFSINPKGRFSKC